MTPLIGVVPDLDERPGAPRYRLDHRYVAAVEAAGGRPVILPLGSSPAGLDGLLLTGGDDIRSGRWGEPPHPKARPMAAARERSDLALARAADRAGLPTLGICLGSQLINVVRGGSLVQHLPVHRRLERHPIRLEPRTRLSRILRVGRARVNSHHHQAVGRLGRGLVVSARAADGVIEAVEDPRARFWVGVQWHPERMAGGLLARRLFAAFVAACR